MRRWAWRAILAVAVLLLLPSSVVGVRAFNRACDGSLEGLRYLSNVRAQLASATAPPPTPAPTPPPPTPVPAAAQPQPPTPTPTSRPPEPPPPSVMQRFRETVGAAGDAVLVALIQVKQHDAVAYPAHVVAAHLLDVAGCGKDAVRLQWLKAGLHASEDRQIQYIASSLRADAGDPDDLADLRQVVRTWTERAPASVSLRRVLAALDEPKT
jgi:hypothetical protein